MARVLDRDWWQAVCWTLDWLDKDLCCEVFRQRYDLNLALLEYGLDRKQWELHWEQAQELQSLLRSLKMPWLGKGPDRKEVRSLAAQWTAIFGDQNDPEVAKRIEATAAALMARSERSRRANLVD